MLNYQDLPRLSPEQCHRRFEVAKRALGEGVLTRLVAFVLFVLGASRKGITEALNLPTPTLTSLQQRVVRDGLPALEDRRCRSSTFLPPVTQVQRLAPKLTVDQEKIVVEFSDDVQIELLRRNRIQCRTVLLTMLESGLLSAKDVTATLGLSTERIRQLRAKLIESDVEALIDQRRGRQRDLLVTPEVKAEMIQQYVLNLQTGASTSSRQITEDLAARCDIVLAERTARLHLDRLGLRQIRSSLPALLDALKKKLRSLLTQGNHRLAPIRNDLVRYTHERRLQPSSLLRRLNIMILAQAGVAASRAAWYLGCSLAAFRRWSPLPNETAQLLDAIRSGRPPVFSETTRLKVIAFYCQSPLPGCRGWTFSWAAKYLSQNPDIIGRTISSSSIHRILTSHGLRPHLVRYFLHITDPDFFPKMEHILDLYRHPPPYLFCLDECTGIQALERIAVRMATEHGVKIEFEYKRHGTRDLFSVFDVRTGKVFCKVTGNHRQETVVAVLSEHVSQQPENAVLHYICDNLAGHSTELICRKVAELSGVPCPQLKTAVERRQWLQSDEKRIVFHFTPYHGSWLNQVELWFGIVASKCLKGRSFSSVEELTETLIAFHHTWNEHFAHPFNWTFNGDGLHEKAVRRATGFIVLKSDKLKRKFLHKQLLLLRNLVDDYWSAVPKKQWAILHQALLDSNDYLSKIIARHDETHRDLAALTHSLSTSLADSGCDDSNTAAGANYQMPA